MILNELLLETHSPPRGALSPAGSTAAPPTLAFFDSFGREIESYGLNGGNHESSGNARIVGAQTRYDAQGRAYWTSRPFYFGENPEPRMVNASYDLLDRPLRLEVSDPEGPGGLAVTTYEYHGLTTISINAKGQATLAESDMQGRQIRVESNYSSATAAEVGRLKYAYNEHGDLKSVSVLREDDSEVVTTFQYDRRGRKKSMDDPDMGHWEYQYNAAGELTWQKDAKNQEVDITYDALGRMTSRTDADGSASWTYDTAPRSGGTWLGLPRSVANADRGKSFSETFSYDSLGRPSSTQSVREGQTYTSTQEYDAYSRPTIAGYPAVNPAQAFKVENVYNDFGFLKAVREGGGYRAAGFKNEVAAGFRFWEADSYSVWGGIDAYRLGNGIDTDKYFDPVTGRLEGIVTGVGMGSEIQNIQYKYDALGNLVTREDFAQSRRETFLYDGLNRLTTHATVGAPTVTVGYNALGNITQKSDVGAYAYGSKPHALSSAGARSFAYDANGNMASRTIGTESRSFDWSAANQVHTLRTGASVTQFWFGADRQRLVQDDDGVITRYIGGAYEEVAYPNGRVEKKHYIMTPAGRVAVRVQTEDEINAVETRFFHQDNLGSIHAVSNEHGQVERRYQYDAWGRQSETYRRPAATLLGGATLASAPTRGYTDHEMLGDHGLIHMNGRVYDHTVARFLSADPFVQDANDSQSYNRYSYVLNNPLVHTDPSGYFSLKDVFKIVAIVAVAFYAPQFALKHLGVKAAAAGTAGLTTTQAAIINGAIGGAAGGFAVGFTGSLLNGGSLGDAFKSGLIGGLAGAVTGGFLGKIGSMENLAWYETGALHGLVHGSVAEATGGSFRHGFAAGFFTGSSEGAIAKRLGGAHINVKRAVAAAVGGTASVLGGGKFANGAVQGLFSYMFKQESQDRSEHLPSRTITRWGNSSHGELLYGGESGFKAYGKISDLESLAIDLDMVYHADDGRCFIDDLFKAKGITIIDLDASGKSFTKLSGTIVYDLTGAQQNRSTPAFIALGHEIAHSRDLIYGVQPPKTNVDYGFETPPWEVRSVALENSIRSHYGLPKRESYGTYNLDTIIVTP